MSAPQGMVQAEVGQVLPGLGRVRASCSDCERAWLVPPASVGQICACGRGPIEASSGPVPKELPEAWVPARVDRAHVKKLLSDEIRSSWLLERGASAAQLAERAQLVWWPRWQLDATAVGHYSVEVGYDYEARSNVERFSGGQWTTEEQIDVRVDWQPRTGEIVQRLHDVPAPALDDEDRWRQRLGSVDAFEAQPFEAHHIGEDWLELPDLSPPEVWHRAEPHFREWVGRVVQSAAGGQHARNVHLNGRYADPEWTVCLRPVWRTWYTGGDDEVRILVIDALTGERHGMLRASWARAWMWTAVWGIAAATFWFLTLIAIIITILVPFLFALPILTGLAALILTPAAFSPLLTVRRWNARALDTED